MPASGAAYFPYETFVALLPLNPTELQSEKKVSINRKPLSTDPPVRATARCIPFAPLAIVVMSTSFNNPPISSPPPPPIASR